MKLTKQIEFFWQGVLPTATHQGRRQNNRGGYATDAGKLAKATWRAIFEKHAPEAPFRGAVAVSLSMTWPHTKAQSGLFAIRKTSKPDLDNVLKFVLDTMTDLGFWEDDKQVCSIDVCKWQGDVPGIYCLVVEKPLSCEDGQRDTKTNKNEIQAASVENSGGGTERNEVMNRYVVIGSMMGMVFHTINVAKDKSELNFYSNDCRLKMYHDQECCENVYLEDICGDLDDLIDSPILQAERVTNSDNPPADVDECHLWTFYKLSTIKGSVTLRWLGQSNGYYSIDVSILFLDNN